MSTVKATKIVDVFGRILPTLGKGRVNLAALGSDRGIISAQDFRPDVSVWCYAKQPCASGDLDFCDHDSGFITFLSLSDFATIILSWVVMFTQSRGPYIEVIQDLAEPLLAPFRRLMPNMGMIDLSPTLAFLALYIAEILMNEVARILLVGL